jgi:hypothetical protein
MAKRQELLKPLTLVTVLGSRNAPQSSETTAASSLKHEHNLKVPPSTPSKNKQHTSTRTDATAAPLLDNDKPISALERDWPKSPKAIRHSLWVGAWNFALDILLLACAVAFLAFAAIVSHYDKVPIDENPQMTRTLLNASKYVGRSIWLQA